ncbi:mirror-image polydactyly gene 1 protein-like isoform X1 [Eucyclogobius newberryi]|uniref:mirror-image polydactyly gene 1 protein-like isoform X1 n=2 Tax=Eucyclogobius newberryi TaxID=166745 RepID=UPI003B5C578B
MASRAQDLKLALTRTKVRIRGLELQVHREPGQVPGPDLGPAQSPDTGSTWISKELRDSLVDMYKANPRVNDELRHRLPSPGRSPRGPLALSPRSPPRSLPRSPPRSPPKSPPKSPQTPTKALVQTRSPPRSPGILRSGISPGHTCSPAPPSPPRAPPSPPRAPPSPPRAPPSPPVRKSPSGPRSGPKLGLNHGVSVMEAELKSACDRMEPSTNHNTAFQDRDKNITFLLKELDSLRDLNSKLQEQLLQKEKELQRKDLNEQLRVSQSEQEMWARTTELVEQLMDAQKEREQAMMSRLLLANEERDQALLTAQRLSQAAANQFSVDLDSVEDSDLDVLQLLEQLCAADSSQQVEQYGPILVQRVRLARQRRSDITAQEISAVMDERDTNAAKVKRLEEELRERHSTQAELLMLQRERDAAVCEQQHLEAELQKFRANPSHSEAPPPVSPTDDVTATLLPDDVTALQQQLMMMSQQKKSVEAELLQANERVRRLERLVEVLRKKVGTGSVRAIV